VDLAEYRRTSQAAWDRIAPVWDRERDFLSTATRLVDERLVERLDIRRGETVLELAAGTGETTPEIAERVGEDGTVISTDFAVSMVDVARAQSQRLGLSNVEHRRLDAERMDLDDASVDRVCCRFGYMLMADPAAALAETRRVLRRSGLLAFAVWAAAQRNPWAAIPASTMVELGHGAPPDPDAPGPFTMADPEVISAIVGAAGFGKPDIEDVPVNWNYADADEHWTRTITLSPSTAQRLRELSEAERELVRETVKERVEERLAEGPQGMNGVALVVTCE
jgi:ubiquinone/menaquinone biosynthesis C-methylase UbiE